MAATWTPLSGGSRSLRSVQGPSESPPTLATEGVLLDSVYALSVWLDAGEGQTITAETGQVDVYLYDNGVWGLAPALVLLVPAGSLGQRRVLLWTVMVDARRGRLAPICNSISVSGATVTLEVLVTVDRKSDHGSA